MFVARQDLVRRCRTLRSMLEDVGYKDTEHEDNSTVHDNNTLIELSNKALIKNKKFYSTNSNQLSMYSHAKPKLGTSYARKWAHNNKVIITTRNSFFAYVRIKFV